jgi:hypothetical protein
MLVVVAAFSVIALGLQWMLLRPVRLSSATACE